MRFRLQEVTFELPPELDPPFSQHYRAEAEGATVAVERGDDGEPADVVAELRQRMLQAFPAAELGEVADVALLGRAGQRYAFAITDEGGQAGAQVIVGPDEGDPPGTVVRIGWQGKGDRAGADAALDAILASVRPGDTREDPGPGQRRWWIGGFAFALPQAYQCRPELALEGYDEQVALAVTLHPFDSERVAIDDRVAAELAAGFELLTREDVPIIYGERVRVRLRPVGAGGGAGDARSVAISLQRHEVGNPVRIRQIEVRVAGPAALVDQLNGIHERLLASVIVENPR